MGSFLLYSCIFLLLLDFYRNTSVRLRPPPHNLMRVGYFLALFVETIDRFFFYSLRHTDSTVHVLVGKPHSFAPLFFFCLFLAAVGSGLGLARLFLWAFRQFKM